MSLRSIIVVDESGIVLAAYPSDKNIDYIGGFLTAVTTATQTLSERSIKVIDAENIRYYIERIKENNLLLLGVEIQDEWYKDELSVKWFISELSDEIVSRVKGSAAEFGLDISSALEPFLEKQVKYFNEIAEKLLKLSKTFQLAKKVIGMQAESALKQCEEMGITLIAKDGKIYIKESTVKIEKVADIVEGCNNKLKKYLREVL